MKKSNIFLLVALISCVFIAGCSLTSRKNPLPEYTIPPFSLFDNDNQNISLVPPTTETSSGTTPTITTFSTIADAMNNNLTLECKYTDENGKKIITQIKNRRVLTGSGDENDPQKSAHILFKYDQAWIWDTATKKGIVVYLNELPVDKGLKFGKTEIRSTDEVLKQMEIKRHYCRISNLADNLFDPPTDIKFTGEDQNT